MNTATRFFIVTLGAVSLLIAGALMDGPDDLDLAQDIADDALTAQQVAECRHIRGRDAEVYTVGQHTVCRAAGLVAGKP